MRAVRGFLGSILVLAAAWPVALAAAPKDLVVIPQSAQNALIERDIPTTFKASAFFLAEWDAAQQEVAIQDEEGTRRRHHRHRIEHLKAGGGSTHVIPAE